MYMEAMDIPSFATTQLALLSAELAAETATTTSLLSTASPTALSRAGLAILNLVFASQRTGLGGKNVVELEKDPAIGNDGGIGDHGIRVGDIVRMVRQPKGSERKKERRGMEEKGVQGVVVRLSVRNIQVALDKDDDDDDDAAGLAGRLWLVKLANEVTYKRMNWTMERLKRMSEGEYTTLIRVLFGLDSPSPLPADLENPETGAGSVGFIDPTLNESQKDAVRFAIASKDVALIHGPPGTGKTYTLIELVLQLLQRGLRVLVCGPSNISVDNIVERLAPHKVPIVRLGHPARLLPSVLDHSLDMLTQTSEASAIVRDIRKEMDQKRASIRKTRNGKERRAIYGEMRELRKDFRERERKCVSTLVGGSKVVLATLHGAGGSQVRHEKFDVVIIDEASQALEAQCWVPLLTAKKVVLAGDHLQLPPTVKSLNSRPAPPPKEPTKGGTTLETTMFDRLLALHGPSIKRMLTVQYRMHERIMRFPSDELYGSKLTAAEAVGTRLLKDLPYDGVHDTDATREPLVFLDTQGGDFPEDGDDDSSAGGALGDSIGGSSSSSSSSKSNEAEAALVRAHVAGLVSAGVRPSDVAVVTPYNAQLALLARDLGHRFPGIELGSVDGFQGREKEAVVVSLVRSNPARRVGFLADRRRLNVAMTRPRRHLCVVGDSETVRGGSTFLGRWMAFLEENADLRYPDVAALDRT